MGNQEQNEILTHGDFISEIQNQIISHVYDLLEEDAKNNSHPKIYGELTLGKLNWRGIKMIKKHCLNMRCEKTWLEQRGKRISRIVTMVTKSDLSNYTATLEFKYEFQED